MVTAEQARKLTLQADAELSDSISNSIEVAAMSGKRFIKSDIPYNSKCIPALKAAGFEVNEFNIYPQPASMVVDESCCITYIIKW